MKLFTHSGAAGDLVYGLAAMKRMGGGGFRIINPRNEYCSDQNMLPLLYAQDYCESMIYGKDMSVVNLDKFRDTPSDLNLVIRHLRAFGLDETNWNAPWLTVPDPPFIKHMTYALINCTPRYPASNFLFWTSEIQHLREQVGWENVFFVGSEEEWIYPFTELVRIPTANALELAQLVKHASIISCKESLILALARGLGHYNIRLVCPDGYDHLLWHTKNETVLNRPIAKPEDGG